jgi:serine/threonine-protein phosphatase 2A regulatory subunit A
MFEGINILSQKVRDAATKNLKVFVEKFGTDWAQNRIIPKVVALGKDPSYLTRMTSLNAIGFLAEALGQV